MTEAEPIVSPWAAAPERRDRNRREKRTAILKAAAQAFSEQGYAGASLDGIAAALGISKPTIYYNVGDKDALFYACYAAVFHELDEVQQKLEGGDMSARAMLRAWVERYVEMVTGELGYCLVMTDLHVLGAGLRKKIDQHREDQRQFLLSVLDRGQRNGEFSPPSSETALSIIAGALNWIPRWYDARQYDRGRIAERFIQSFERVLLVKERPAGGGGDQGM